MQNATFRIILINYGTKLYRQSEKMGKYGKKKLSLFDYISYLIPVTKILGILRYENSERVFFCTEMAARMRGG